MNGEHTLTAIDWELELGNWRFFFLHVEGQWTWNLQNQTRAKILAAEANYF